MEHLDLETKFSATDAGAVEGIAWPFGSPDRVGDLITKGAFATAKAPLPMLDGHNQRDVIGVWESINETEAGLIVKGRLLIDDLPAAKAMRAKLLAGAMRGLSIGFLATKALPRTGGGRTITALDLAEISIVSVPAHPGARVTSTKGAESNDMNDTTTPAAPETKAADVDVSAIVTKALEPVTKGFTDRLDKIEAKMNRPAGGKGDGEASEERKSFATYLRLGNQTPVDEVKALTVSSDPNGGYLAPAEMSTEFVRDLTEFSPIRSVASVRTTGAPAVKYPRRTSITNAQWEDELEESDESTVGFGMIEVPVNKITTFVDISNELLADSAGMAEAEVRLALAEDFGKKEAYAFVLGSGDKRPEGLMTNADILSTVNGHATALNTDKLIELLYALPATYRNASGAAWGMNGSTLAAVRKLKNGTTGEYIWQPALVAGQPETLLGKPVIEMLDMPDIADGNYPIIYGDFSAYRIVDRLALSVLSDPYTQARKGVTRLHATRRVGGRVLQAARFRKLKSATS